jgi:predicted MFS family arabinose efflux permease
MFMAVYVLYMTRDLGLGAMGIGLVFATGGVGSFAGSIGAQSLARRLGPRPTMIGAQIAFGLTGMMVPVAVLVPTWALAMIVASEFALRLVADGRARDRRPLTWRRRSASTRDSARSPAALTFGGRNRDVG